MRRVPAARTAAACLGAACILVAAAACETLEKRDYGTAIGGVLGGFIGHRVDDGGARGAVIGALLGAVVGRMIGQYMDDADRARLAETINATPRGQTVSWHNPDSKRDFAVTPTSDFYARGNQECRSFNQVVYVDGRREVMEGVACRSPGSDEFEFRGQAA